MEYYRMNELYHHGIKGQKWGVRRYQNEDGTLTPAGVKRYGEHGSDYLKAKREYRKAKAKSKRGRFAFGLARMLTVKSPVLNTIARGSGGIVKSANMEKQQRAKDNLTRAKYTRDYETGRRKKLDGQYQPDVEDEVKYGRKESVRIAKRRNRGMTNEQAHRVTNAKRVIKGIANIGVHALITYDMVHNHGKGTRKVAKAGINAGIKIANTIARGASAAHKVYNDYNNVSILDASGKVISRYHDATNWGEAMASNLFNS